jgi:hypothetical protein
MPAMEAESLYCILSTVYPYYALLFTVRIPLSYYSMRVVYHQVFFNVINFLHIFFLCLPYRDVSQYICYCICSLCIGQFQQWAGYSKTRYFNEVNFPTNSSVACTGNTHSTVRVLCMFPCTLKQCTIVLKLKFKKT